MSDLLAIASSGLRSYRAALDAMGENVAGANTPGFARRDIQLRGLAAGALGPLYRPTATGLGVDVVAIRRAHDAFLSADARFAEADLARLNTTAAWLGEIETTLSAGGASIGIAITDFYNAAQGVAADPGTAVARNLMLEAADTLATRFRDSADGLDTVARAIDRDLDGGVALVNNLARQVASVNGRLKRTPEGSGTSAALMDERDRILTELAKVAAIEVREGARGVVAVRLGDALGPPLVDLTTTYRLVAATGAGGPGVKVAKGGADATNAVLGGELAGLVAAGRRLAEARAGLDALAGDLAANLNLAHAGGVDLAGAAGEPLFALQKVEITGSPANVGAAAVDTEVADGAPLAAVGYDLSYDAGTALWTLARRDGSGTTTGVGALTLDGLTVTPTGAAAQGDLFLIDPRAGAAGIALRIEDPNKVAAADPFIAGPALANRGLGAVTVTPDLSAALPVLPAYRVRFDTVASFEIVDPVSGTVLAPSQPYVPGAAIAGAGFSFTLTGAPALGDRFDIARAVQASGDAGNLKRLVATRDAPVGVATFEERWERQTGRLAGRISDATTGATAARVARDTAQGAVETNAGVDLDREAADLVRFQQAYQASARVITAARDMFDTLFAIG